MAAIERAAALTAVATRGARAAVEPRSPPLAPAGLMGFIGGGASPDDAGGDDDDGEDADLGLDAEDDDL